MKIAVCDDLKNEREILISMLKEYFAEKKLNCEITEFISSEELLSNTFIDGFSLVFLDIYMTGISGIETAERIKQLAPECLIIFTTTSKEHGAEAFDLEAFHYLVKPFDKEKLFSVLNKWYDLLCEVKTVTLKCGRTERKVFIKDIIYIEVLGRNCTVHTANEKIETQTSLSAVEGMLPQSEFYKPIRYCLVALKQIKSVGEDSLFLVNGETIPIARREKDNIKQIIASYRLKRIRR